MKVKPIKEELRNAPREQLEAKVVEFRKELLMLRLQASTAPVKDFAARKTAFRRLIACGLTFLNQKKQ